MSTLSEFSGTHWSGTAELWLDPAGNQASQGECTLTVEDDRVRYRWIHEGSWHDGVIDLTDGACAFTDSWHAPDSMACEPLSGDWGLFRIEGRYGPDRDWGWRIGMSHRAPTGQLVLQMTNIAPWGEEARAVRMVVDPAA